MADTDDERPTEELDDAIGGVIARKTRAMKATAADNKSKIKDHDEAIERILRRLDNTVERDGYLQTAQQLKADAREALTLAREARSEQAALGPMVRDELLKVLREDVANGLNASHMLATTHSATLAELQSAVGAHEGRIAATELTARSSADSTDRAAATFEERLVAANAGTAAQISRLHEEMAEARADAARAQASEAEAKAELARLASYVDNSTKSAEAERRANAAEIDKLRGVVSSMSVTLTEYLGIEASAAAKWLHVSRQPTPKGAGFDCTYAADGSAPPDPPEAAGGPPGSAGPVNYQQPGASPPRTAPRTPKAGGAGEAAQDWSHEYGSAGRPAGAAVEIDGEVLGGSPPSRSPKEGEGEGKGAGRKVTMSPPLSGRRTPEGGRHRTSGVLTGQVSDAMEMLYELQEQHNVLRREMGVWQETNGLEITAADARLKTAMWNQEGHTARLGKIEAAVSTLAPMTAVGALEEVRAEAARTAARLDELEREARDREASQQETWRREQLEAGSELARKTDMRVDEAAAAQHLATKSIGLRLDGVEDIAESGRAAADAAMRSAMADAQEIRTSLRDQVTSLRDEASGARAADRADLLRQLAETASRGERETQRVASDNREALKSVRHRLAACWEGMRESRVELGDVMQTLHHLVERSEIQHVINQMLTRAAYANLTAYGGGAVGSSRTPFISPRVGLAEPSAQPPHLPHAIQLNHRRCVKRGECSCTERLSATLGAGDPRLALDNLFERQLRLLLAVRKLWRQAESSRGELPGHTPKLPPIGNGGAATWGAAAANGRRGPDGYGAGDALAYDDELEGGADTSVVGLPERLTDLVFQ